MYMKEFQEDSGRETKRKREKISIIWFSTQMTTIAMTGLGEN